MIMTMVAPNNLYISHYLLLPLMYFVPHNVLSCRRIFNQLRQVVLYNFSVFIYYLISDITLPSQPTQGNSSLILHHLVHGY